MRIESEVILKEHNLHDTHWGKIIINAEKLNSFSYDEVEEAKEWKSCACGKLDNHIERYGNECNEHLEGAPVDDKLQWLGMEFESVVEDNNFVQSAICLIGIETRSKELLMETHGDTE